MNGGGSAFLPAHSLGMALGRVTSRTRGVLAGVRDTSQLSEAPGEGGCPSTPGQRWWWGLLFIRVHFIFYSFYAEAVCVACHNVKRKP